jgi:hypothetical protein
MAQTLALTSDPFTPGFDEDSSDLLSFDPGSTDAFFGYPPMSGVTTNDFNPVQYTYLNPELHLPNVEAAYAHYQSAGRDMRLYAVILLPERFSWRVYWGLGRISIMASGFMDQATKAELHDDTERLCVIHYMRVGRFYQEFECRSPLDFNYDVYQMLYPHAKMLSRDQAYLDYLDRRNNGTDPLDRNAIGKVADFYIQELTNVTVNAMQLQGTTISMSGTDGQPLFNVTPDSFSVGSQNVDLGSGRITIMPAGTIITDGPSRLEVSQSGIAMDGPEIDLNSGALRVTGTQVDVGDSLSVGRALEVPQLTSSGPLTLRHSPGSSCHGHGDIVLDGYEKIVLAQPRLSVTSQGFEYASFGTRGLKLAGGSVALTRDSLTVSCETKIQNLCLSSVGERMTMKMTAAGGANAPELGAFQVDRTALKQRHSKSIQIAAPTVTIGTMFHCKEPYMPCLIVTDDGVVDIPSRTFCKPLREADGRTSQREPMSQSAALQALLNINVKTGPEGPCIEGQGLLDVAPYAVDIGIKGGIQDCHSVDLAALIPLIVASIQQICQSGA